MTVQQPYSGQVAIPEEKKNRFGKIGSKVTKTALSALTVSLVIRRFMV